MRAKITKVKLSGLGAIDRRTKGGRDAVAFKDALTDALGGSEGITPQERKLVDFIARNCLILDCIDEWIFSQGSVITEKGRALEILQEHLALTNSTARIIGQLGLARRL